MNICEVCFGKAPILPRDTIIGNQSAPPDATLLVIFVIFAIVIAVWVYWSEKGQPPGMDL